MHNRFRTARTPFWWRLLLALLALLTLESQVACLLPTVNEKPTARVNSAIDAVDKLVVTFEAADLVDPDGEVIGFRWDFGDASIGEGRTIVHRYSEKGIYFVVLTVTDDDGAQFATSPTRIVVPGENQPPVATFTAQPTEGPAPLSVEFNASDSNDSDPGDRISSYEWQFGDGEGTADGVSRDHTYNREGIFTVILTVKDTVGASDTKTALIHVLRRQ